MKIKLVFTNVIGMQPPEVEVDHAYFDFARDMLKIYGIAKADGATVYKKVWADEKPKVMVSPRSRYGEIDLFLPISILEFFEVKK